MCPKVSIAVPVYCVASRIERCAISLFEQSYKNIEYIFVDDCSPDNSIAILKEVSKKYPERVPFIKIINHKKNRGLAAARNTAVDNATGEFILHVDSDDYLEINSVEVLINRQIEEDFDIVNAHYLVHNGTFDEEWVIQDFHSPFEMTEMILSRRTPVCVAGRLIRKSLYTDNKIRAIDGINMAEDYAVSPLLSYYARKTSTLHSPLYHYDRTNEQSYTNSFSEKKYEQIWIVLDSLCTFFNDKGPFFQNALNVGKTAAIIMQMKACLLVRGHKGYYKRLSERLSLIDRESKRAVPLFDRIFICVRNYTMLRLYMSVAFLVKSFIKKIKQL